MAPPEQLVVGGLYRYVRNPMYLAVVAIILGQAASVDRRLLGATLTGAVLIQVIPAVTRPIAHGTWRLILAEVSCWATFGTGKRDGPLIILGTTGVISALLMLNRALTTANQPAADNRPHRTPAPNAC